MASGYQPPPVQPVLLPPHFQSGPAAWVHDNLLSNWYNTALTVIFGMLGALALWFGLSWIFTDADWQVIPTLGGRIFIGQYNTEGACPGQNCFWRPQAALLLVTVLLGMAWAVAGAGSASTAPQSTPPWRGCAGGRITRRIAILAAAVATLSAFLPYSLERMGMDVRLLLLANAPALLVGFALGRHTALGTARWITILGFAVFLVTLVLLRGLPAVPGLQPVLVTNWGGLMLNLLLAVAGIVTSLPLGIALALGRRSQLPVVKLLCVVFIEVFRGVPLITLLFMSQVLVPLAFPENFPQNPLFRASVIIILFSTAYMAENIRGGLESVHAGEEEAARALGLPGWRTTALISLPQAIRNVIPAIVGQFVALFKDTSLVYMIGMLDVVAISRAFIQGNPEYLPSTLELFIFLAVVFWVFTYTISHVGHTVEEHMGVGQR